MNLTDRLLFSCDCRVVVLSSSLPLVITSPTGSSSTSGIQTLLQSSAPLKSHRSSMDMIIESDDDSVTVNNDRVLEEHEHAE